MIFLLFKNSVLSVIEMKKKKSKKNKKIRVKSVRKTLPLPELEAKAASLWNRYLLRDAARIYSKIITIDHDHLEAHFRLGFIMIQNGRFDQALQHLLQARELSPFDESVHYTLGETYGQMGRTEEAINSYLACLELCRGKSASTPGVLSHRIPEIRPSTVMANLAYLYFRTNRYKQANEYTLETLKNEPGNLIANMVHAKLDRNKGQYDKAALRLDSLPLVYGNNLINASILNELGHVYDRLGKYGKAIKSITESNRLMGLSPGARSIDPRQIPYIIHLTKKYLDKRDNIHSQSAYQLKESDFQAPVFLIGFPRSGTTLTEQLLYDELDMTVSDEFPVITDVIKALPLLLKRKFSYPADINSLSPDEISVLRKEYWMRMEKKIPDAVEHQANFLDKLPLNLINLPFIEQIFPDCRIIVALRDPRDVCISNFFQMFKLNESMVHFLDFGDTVKFYNTVMSLWVQLRKKIQVPFIESRYENLVDNKEAGIAALSVFLRFDSHNIASSARSGNDNRYISTPSHYDVTQPIYRRSLERWRNYQDILGKYFAELDPIARELSYPLMRPTNQS